MASPILSPLCFNFNSNNNKNLSFLSANHLLFSVSKPTNTNKGFSIMLFSYKTGSGLTTEEEVLLESYGFDSSECISEPKTERRKELQRKRKMKEVVAEEGAKPPRTVHKLLQVHFVEMDSWVVSNVLQPNLEWMGFLDVSVIHPVRVQNFLEPAD